MLRSPSAFLSARLPRSVIADRRGSVSVEFALIGLLLIMLLLGAMDLARYQATLEAVRVAADAGGRLATVAFANNAASGCSAVPAGNTLQSSVLATQPLPMLDPSSLAMSSSCNGPDSNGILTTSVTATYPFLFIAPMFSTAPMTFQANSTVSFTAPTQ